MPVREEMAVSPVKSLHWEKFPPMAQRRVYCTPVRQGGVVYVLGGCSESGAPLDSAELLDVESQTWSRLPPLPTARAGASAVALAGGRVMVLGGMSRQQAPLASVEVYHPDEGKWESKAGLGQPSMGVTAVEKGERKREEKTLEIAVLWCDGLRNQRVRKKKFGKKSFRCLAAFDDHLSGEKSALEWKVREENSYADNRCSLHSRPAGGDDGGADCLAWRGQKAA